MPKFFIPIGQEEVEMCQPRGPSGFKSIRLLINGLPKVDEWVPLPMELIHEDEGKALKYSSSPWLGSHALILRPECLNVIGQDLKSRSELLPIDCPEAEVYFCNPMNIANAFDEQASTIKRFDGGGIKFIETFNFNKEVVRDIHIFKIPNMRVSPTFVSEEFVDHWCESSLTGLDFELVWDSSGPPVVRKMTGNFIARKGK